MVFCILKYFLFLIGIPLIIHNVTQFLIFSSMFCSAINRKYILVYSRNINLPAEVPEKQNLAGTVLWDFPPLFCSEKKRKENNLKCILNYFKWWIWGRCGVNWWKNLMLQSLQVYREKIVWKKIIKVQFIFHLTYETKANCLLSNIAVRSWPLPPCFYSALQ